MPPAGTLPGKGDIQAGLGSVLSLGLLGGKFEASSSLLVSRGVFVSKSGLRILIRAPEMPFSVPPKTPKMGVFGYFGGTKNGTWGARIKILRPLFNTNTPPKTPI